MIFDTVFLIDPFLANFGLQQVASPVPVAFSVQNENYRIMTNKGLFFIRFYPRGTNLSNIQREHRVLHWSSLWDLPTYPPLLGLDGKDIYQVEDRYGTLVPLIGVPPI